MLLLPNYFQTNLLLLPSTSQRFGTHVCCCYPAVHSCKVHEQPQLQPHLS
jgi:hypothetical protein